MSATEIIEQIQKLPEEERRKVEAFFQQAGKQPGPGPATVRYASDAEFDKAAGEVLRDHAELLRRLAK
jgi:hypothetical protein